MRIYLADLTHIGHGVATEAFPLNVGLIASYARKQFGAAVDISLFKYPEDIIREIRANPPDILGLSNYTWNANLAYFVTKIAKQVSPKTIVIWGGTNYPFDAFSQEGFLRKRPLLDMHVYYEGEQAFAGLVSRMLAAAKLEDIFEQPLGGIQFIHKATGAFVTGDTIPRIKELDSIPSPYVTGLLDKFFDGKLTPLVETTRGCPFRCNFCNAGEKYFDKINMFSDAYVEQELSYIAQRASKLGIGHITLADNNFGMYPRDSKTAELLYNLQQKYGWPKSVTAWTGKNAKDRVIDFTRILGETLSISMSVQSMDAEVLKSVKRGNIKIDHYRAISEELYRQGRPQHTEVIMPLPGETFDSHLRGLGELLDLKISRVFSHTLQMLHGTPYKDDQNFIRDHGYQTKWRLVPLDFTDIEGERVFDSEEVAIATNTFSFAEYIEARKYMFIIDLCFNSGLFDPLKKYLRSKEIKISDWIASMYGEIAATEGGERKVFDSFADDTQTELWGTEQELIAYYSTPDNYSRLIAGDVGGNVLFKHRVWMLSGAGLEWTKRVFKVVKNIVRERTGWDGCEAELSDLERYVLMTISDSFSPEAVTLRLAAAFGYDIPAWLAAPDSAHLKDFFVEQKLALVFSFSPRSLEVALDGFRRYGTDLSGLIKLVQRSHFTFTRAAAYETSQT